VDVKNEAFLETIEDESHCLDLRDYNNAVLAVKGMDWVFDLSANMGGIGFITEVGAEVMHDNALININVMEASRANKVQRVFFSSSACVYNQDRQMNPLVEPLKEEHAVPANPDSFYGWEKLFTEFLMKAYYKDYGLDIRIARFHNIYGPYGTYQGGREKAPAALCRKVAEAKDGDSIVIWGDGKQTRSFLYIGDALEAIYQLMLSDFVEPLNIGSDELVSVDELVDIIIEASGKKLTKTYDLTKPQGVRGRNADLTLVKQVLGWTPKISYKEGLAKTYHWIESMVKHEKT
jgi:nucleoside-diphosphate-sugar epimerase